MSPRWRRRAVIAAVIVAAVVLVRATLLRKEPVPVTVFRVAPGRVEETVTNSKAGTVKTRRRAALSPEIGGRIEALPVRKGDRVRKGQLLVRLAGADYQAQVNAPATLDRGRARGRARGVPAGRAGRARPGADDRAGPRQPRLPGPEGAGPDAARRDGGRLPGGASPRRAGPGLARVRAGHPRQDRAARAVRRGGGRPAGRGGGVDHALAARGADPGPRWSCSTRTRST